jgi:hypothetical protein
MIIDATNYTAIASLDLFNRQLIVEIEATDLNN